MVIRALRVARIFKVFKFFRPLKSLMDTLVISFPSYAAILILTLLFCERDSAFMMVLPHASCSWPVISLLASWLHAYLCILTITGINSFVFLCIAGIVFAIMGMSVFGGLDLDLNYLVFPSYPNFNTFLSSVLITFQVGKQQTNVKYFLEH